MRLCLVTEFYYPEIGGIQTHVYGLAKMASKHGYDVTVLTTVQSKKRVEKVDDIRIIRVKFPRYAGFFAIFGLEKKLENIFRQIRPDILHVHHAFSPLGLASPAAAKKLGIPIVLTNHSIPIGYEFYKKIWNNLSRVFVLYHKMRNIRKYDAVIAVSPLAAEYMRLYYPDGKIHIIPPPVDDDFFQVRASKSDVGFDEDEKIILFVGRIAPKKGLEFALYAFRMLSKLEPNARLCIVGPSDTPYTIHLKKLMSGWGLERNVLFMGSVSKEQLKKLYAASDVFIFPSYGGESFGIVVLESMATGTPVVATLGGALGKYIKKYKLGFVTGFNTKRFVAAILKLLGDNELRKRMGERARQFARFFSWEKTFKRIENIYRSVMRSDREGSTHIQEPY